MPEYYYLNRPPAVGTEPAGWTRRETWIPKRFDHSKRGAWGIVEYPAPIGLENIYRFELLPVNKTERFAYACYLECDRNPVEAKNFALDYWTASEATIQGLAERDDYFAQTVIELGEANVTWPQVAAAWSGA